jgi:hypothetical protein
MFSFQFFLAGQHNFLQFPDIFGLPTIKTNGKTQKLNSKHISGRERARRAGIFLEKTKISANSGKHVKS